MRRIITITAAALITLALAGCTARSSGSTASVDSGSSAASAPSSAGGAAATSTTGDLAGSERAVVTTGTMSITAEKPSDAADTAIRIATTAGGRVDARHESAPRDGDRGSADVTLRVPASALNATIDQLRSLGTVDDLALSSNDVTSQTVDLAARITAAQASVDRLVTLLGRATTTTDLVDLENSLATRQSDLESMQAQSRTLADQIAYSSLAITFLSPANAPATSPKTFATGLVTGWHSFTAFVAGLLVVLGVALPWIACLAVLTVLVFVIRRLRRRGLVR